MEVNQIVLCGVWDVLVEYVEEVINSYDNVKEVMFGVLGSIEDVLMLFIVIGKLDFK